MWSLWWVQILEYITAWKSHLIFCLFLRIIIIVMQTYLKALDIQNACQVYWVDRVLKILSVLWIIFHVIYKTVYLQLTNFSYVNCEHMCTISYHHHHHHHNQIGSMGHSPLFTRVVCAVCFAIYDVGLFQKKICMSVSPHKKVHYCY